MIVGIVGSEEIKFTLSGRASACLIISDILSRPGVTEVVSGACHLGGIDEWAVEIGHAMGLRATEFPPRDRSWAIGYRPRNLQIVARSNEVHCITVNRLPHGYHGMKFPYCYHCTTDEHVKSGGCWTAKQAERAGKRAYWHVVTQ